MKLCGLFDGVEGGFGFGVLHAFLWGIFERRELAVGPEARKALLGLQQAGRSI